MKDQVQILARYQQLRQVGMKVNHTLVDRLTRDMLDEGGHKLGILHGNVLRLESEDESAVLMDFCIHDVHRDGLNAVRQFLAETPYPPGSDEAIWLEALAEARFSLFLIEKSVPGLGVEVRDLVSFDTRLLVDVNLGQTARPGIALATRLIEPAGITVSTGAALPLGVLPTHDAEDALQKMVDTAWALLGRWQTPEQRSDSVGTLLRALLEGGAMSRVGYAEPGEGPDSRPSVGHPVLGRPEAAVHQVSAVGPYEPCPCGSGKKYKFCCRSKR